MERIIQKFFNVASEAHNLTGFYFYPNAAHVSGPMMPWGLRLCFDCQSMTTSWVETITWISSRFIRSRELFNHICLLPETVPRFSSMPGDCSTLLSLDFTALYSKLFYYTLTPVSSLDTTHRYPETRLYLHPKAPHS
jgi:hypothetical protein